MIGVQLYAFQKQDVENDLAGILRRLSEIGYGAVEGQPGHQVNYRRLLDDCSMRFAAKHVTPGDLRDAGSLIAYTNAMGATDVCSSGPMDWNKREYADFVETCRFLNEKGRILRDAGIFLHYHNHEFEFVPVQSRTTAMDVLLENLDFDVVDLCLDVGWVWRAGLDPVEFLDRHSARVSYVHIRDFAGARSVPLGNGDMDLKSVLAAIRRLPCLRWLVVEQDPGSPDPVQDLRVSMEFLKKNGHTGHSRR